MLVFVVWAITLMVLAGLAPVAQVTVGLPFELLSLVMLTPALACAVVLIVPSWMPEPWKRVGESSVLLAAMVSVSAVASASPVHPWSQRLLVSSSAPLTWVTGN